MESGINLFWGYLQDGSIVTLGMNVKEIKAPKYFLATYWYVLQNCYKSRNVFGVRCQCSGVRQIARS
jgi:hypothetical protein